MQHKKSTRVRRTQKQSTSRGVLSSSLYGTAVGGICMLALSLIFTLAALRANDPDTLIFPLSLAANVISFLLCGFMSARRARTVFPCSLISAVALCALLLLISLFLDGSLSSQMSLGVSLLIRLSFVLLSLLGGMLGANSGTRKRRKR